MQLTRKDLVAFRRGAIHFLGWRIAERTQRELLKRRRGLTSRDLQPEFRQKRVDMKIGLDVAWLASKRIAERLILVTADSDFIPAMKFARREGTQVVLVPMGVKVQEALREHADFVRPVTWPPSKVQAEDK
jgi:uncharacterized LabA/DUF88 family protein